MNYDYKCPKCEQIREIWHGMNEAPEIKCSKCKQVCKKLISGGAGIKFVGSGFYVNDYKDK